MPTRQKPCTVGVLSFCKFWAIASNAHDQTNIMLKKIVLKFLLAKFGQFVNGIVPESIHIGKNSWIILDFYLSHHIDLGSQNFGPVAKWQEYGTERRQSAIWHWGQIFWTDLRICPCFSSSVSLVSLLFILQLATPGHYSVFSDHIVLHAGKLHCKIPWRRLESEPVQIELEDIFLIVAHIDDADASTINKRVRPIHARVWKVSNKTARANVSVPCSLSFVGVLLSIQVQRRSRHDKRQGIADAEKYRTNQNCQKQYKVCLL